MSPPSPLPALPSPAAALVTKAGDILLEQRSKRRWSSLLTLITSKITAAQFAHIALRLRNHPRILIRLIAVADDRKLCRHDNISLAAAAHVLARHRLRSHALDVLKRAVLALDPRRDEEQRGTPEILKTLAKTYRTFGSAPFVFDLLVLAYLEAKRIDRALLVVRMLRSRGIQPLIGTCNSLIRVVSQIEGSEAGIEIYREIFNNEEGIRLRVLPKVVIFNTMLVAICREGNLGRMREIREEMEGVGCELNVFTYSVLMLGYCDKGMIEDAVELWKEMVGKGIMPDVMAFNTMIGGWCKVGGIEKAEELYKEMTLSGIEPTVMTFEHLISGHCKVGDVDSGLLLYRDSKRRGLNVDGSMVDGLVGQLCRKRRAVEGLRILRDEMKRESYMPSQRSYEVLIRGFCEIGKIEEAMKLQAEMVGKGYNNTSEVYNAFIDGYKNQRDIEKVERLSAEMHEMVLQEGEDSAVIKM